MKLLFQNAGEIDFRAVSTFGCNVKVSSNPIGHFGTGLKYAIAILLRTGHEITIMSGLDVRKITARKEMIRDKEFELVYADDTPLGFTTELGKGWELWMAYRELFCNCIDEQDSVVCVTDGEKTVAGVTKILVAGQDLLEVHRRSSEFILSGTPAVRLGSVEVYNRPSEFYFYKGIRVHKFPKPCLLTYNETQYVELTEDRIVKDQGMVPYHVAQALLQLTDRHMLERVLTASDAAMEHYFDFWWDSCDASNEFYEVVARAQQDNLQTLNRTAFRMWREKRGGILSPKEVTLTAIQSKSLERALDFCERAGFSVRGSYKLKFVESLGPDILAMADRHDHTILLSLTVLNQGTKQIASALIEEFIHLRYNLEDCTRRLQTFLFDKIVSLTEELKGEPA